MGTRHLIAVQSGGEYKIAQYGQWDGYPDGQGVGILEFLKRPSYVEGLRKKLPHCRFITEEEHRDGWLKAGAKPEEQFVSNIVGERFRKMFPLMNRDHGSDILKLVAESTGECVLKNSIDFAGDSLFCEWAYVVDFDKNAFEVYSGFNHDPVDPSERFAKAPVEADQKTLSGEKYEPVKLLATFPLDNLPSKSVFLETCKKDDEDDE